jgi:hypothetical protein
MWREQRLPTHDPERTSNLTYRNPLAPSELNRAGSRSGEGSNGLFALIERDIRWNAGFPTIDPLKAMT